MKALASIVIALAVSPATTLLAATLPSFGGATVGLPPLSLADSLADGTTTLSRFPRTHVSRPADGSRDTVLSPSLIPRTTPTLKELQSAREADRSRVSRSSGMPIIVPNDAVEYAMRIVTSNPAIDFQLVIKTPLEPQRKVEGETK